MVVLELEDEAMAVKRALGRRVDPLTGRVYHLEFDVPPPKEPGLAARLKVLLPKLLSLPHWTGLVLVIMLETC